MSRGGEHVENHRLANGFFIPRMIQEELTKNQSLRTWRIATRSLKRWICQNQIMSSQSDFIFGCSNWPVGTGCCKPY